MSAQNEIQLGVHTYTVRPQKIGYLIHKLGPNLQEALTAELEGLDGALLAGAKARDVLAVFIPDLMPTWEWLGYASERAFEDTQLWKRSDGAEGSDQYDENADNSPEPLQIKQAFKAASNVNGGEVLGNLKALLGETLTQKVIEFLVEFARQQGALTSPTSAPSPTSPPPSGGSAQTNSGTTPPTTPGPASAA
jgi:hypothetical protein